MNLGNNELRQNLINAYKPLVNEVWLDRWEVEDAELKAASSTNSINNSISSPPPAEHFLNKVPKKGVGDVKVKPTANNKSEGPLNTDQICDIFAKAYKPIVDTIWLERWEVEDAEAKAAQYFAQKNIPKPQSIPSLKAVSRLQTETPPKACESSEYEAKTRLGNQIASARQSIRNLIENVDKQAVLSAYPNFSLLNSLQKEMESLSNCVKNLSNNLNQFEQRIDQLESLSISTSSKKANTASIYTSAGVYLCIMIVLA